MRPRRIVFAGLLLVTLVLAACTMEVEDISAGRVGEVVAIRGTVDETLQVGDFAGYTLTDRNGDTIAVSTDDAPAQGSTVTARGRLKEGPLGIGYYIDTQDT